MRAWNHFITITKHKMLVMDNCFKIGLYKQGLLHDLSKYSPEEFMSGVRYYQGDRSPNAVEREELGFSPAWLHHKGRNKHHFEYWIDFSANKKEGLIGNKMPLNYVLEMVMDRIAACKVYEGDEYTCGSPLAYYVRTSPFIVIHSDTRKLLEQILRMLKAEGQRKTFAYMRWLLVVKKTY